MVKMLKGDTGMKTPPTCMAAIEKGAGKDRI